MDKNIPQFTTNPTENAKDIAIFIIRKYRSLTNEDISKEKLQTLLYLCVRDVFYVTKNQVIEESFELRNRNEIKLSTSLPPMQILKRMKPIINNNRVKTIIDRVLPNYVEIENWKLKKTIVNTYRSFNPIPPEKLIELAKAKANGKNITFPTRKITLEEMWKDANEHKPYDSFFNCYFDE